MKNTWSLNIKIKKIYNVVDEEWEPHVNNLGKSFNNLYINFKAKNDIINDVEMFMSSKEK